MSTAIIFNDDQILCHINKTTSQITGICRFQRSISQSLASTMCRNEVLKHVQPFPEIGGNRRFDNRTIRFCHQTSHTGQLTDLRRRTTSAGISHHINGIERFLCSCRSITPDDILDFQLIHHGLADAVTCLAPDIDHLVVTFAGSHQTGCILLFDLLDFLFGSRNQFRFLFRHQHVVDTDGNTRLGCQPESCLHQVIRKYNCRTQPAFPERCIDQA